MALKVNDGSLTAEVTIVKGSDNRDEPNTEDSQDFEIRETADNSGETKRRRGRPPGSKNKSQAPYGREPEGGIKIKELINSPIDSANGHEPDPRHDIEEDRFDPIEIDEDEDEEEGVEIIGAVTEEVTQQVIQQAQPTSQPAPVQAAEPVRTTSLFNLPSPAQMTETIVKEAIQETAKIFPSVGTSAPTPTQEAPPVPPLAGAPATKSLFANLVKPVNSAPTE